MVVRMGFAEPLYDRDSAPEFGDDSPSFGSLAKMTPRKLNKKPVLVVDPEELAREREHLHLVGAQLMGEDDSERAPAARSTSPLGLASVKLADDYQEYNEQDLPPLDDDFTDPDALLGLSGHDEALEEEAAEPAKRVGLDLDALRQAAGFDEDEEEDVLAANTDDFADFDSPGLPEEPVRRIGIDLDALRDASGSAPEDELVEDALREEPDFSIFHAAVPTELPEKRIGLDLDALRMAGGYDEDEEDEDERFPVSIPDFSAFRSANLPEEHEGEDEAEQSYGDADDWSELEDKSDDFAPIRPAALRPFDPPPEAEPETTDETEPPLPVEPEWEPAADNAPMVEAEPEFEAERDLEPESSLKTKGAAEPSLLRVTTWWPEQEAEAAVPPPFDVEPLPEAEPVGPAENARRVSLGSMEPEDSSEDPAPAASDAEPPPPAHCQVRARLLRTEDRAVRKPKGVRGWLRRLRLWMDGY